MTIKSMGMVSRKVCYEAGYDKAKQENKKEIEMLRNRISEESKWKMEWEKDYNKSKQDIFQKILEICNKGNARQNHIGKFFEIRRLCQDEIKGEEK